MLKEENVAIATNNLGKQIQFGQDYLTILEGIEFHANKGDSVAIVGASGSGKSTLLSLLAGLDTPSAGQISVLGTEITDLDEEGRAQLRAGQIGFIFQNFQLLPSLTALENVMMPMELAGQADARQLAEKWLERVGLAHRHHHYPSQLSGGEQQRVAIARAFVVNPEILFADEPTGNLDRATGNLVSDLLFQLNQELKTTLVVVTHDEKLAQRCGSRWNMDSGRLNKAQ